jgi:hypothetical protein
MVARACGLAVRKPAAVDVDIKSLQWPFVFDRASRGWRRLL